VRSGRRIKLRVLMPTCTEGDRSAFIAINNLLERAVAGALAMPLTVTRPWRAPFLHGASELADGEAGSS